MIHAKVVRVEENRKGRAPTIFVTTQDAGGEIRIYLANFRMPRERRIEIWSENGAAEAVITQLETNEQVDEPLIEVDQELLITSNPFTETIKGKAVRRTIYWTTMDAWENPLEIYRHWPPELISVSSSKENQYMRRGRRSERYW